LSYPNSELKTQNSKLRVYMPQSLIITLLLFAFVLPILGAVALRLLAPRLAPVQLGSAAALLLGVVIASVLVLARSDIPSLQIGNLSILLPVTAPDDSLLPLVPTTAAEQSPVIVATSAPVAATVTPMATVLPAVTATTIPATAAATQTATAEPTAAPTAAATAPPEPTAAPTAAATAPPEPTAAPPTTIPPTAAPAPPAAPRTYTVQPGDTLLSIAKKFNTTVTAIVKANKLTPKQADSLRVGQELVIP
jgi:LysM repeat protein